MIRALDVLFALFGLLFGLPMLLLLAAIVWYDTGPPLFFQVRVGRDQKPFTLIKFRTMKKSAENRAQTQIARTAISPIGHFLRRTKLDELPQLWNVLKGEMSLVGPRPGLYSQKALIASRAKRGIYLVRPGITGLAQLNRVDMSMPERLAAFDKKMIKSLSIKYYLTYIVLTALGKGWGDTLTIAENHCRATTSVARERSQAASDGDVVQPPQQNIPER